LRPGFKLVTWSCYFSEMALIAKKKMLVAQMNSLNNATDFHFAFCISDLAGGENLINKPSALLHICYEMVSLRFSFTGMYMNHIPSIPPSVSSILPIVPYFELETKTNKKITPFFNPGGKTSFSLS
jgi:hypothetical protein